MININDIDFETIQEQSNILQKRMLATGKSLNDNIIIQVTVNFDTETISVGPSFIGIKCSVEELSTIKDWLLLNKVFFQKENWQGKLKDYQKMIMI